jgi:GT2 family glycosyltransferase
VYDANMPTTIVIPTYNGTKLLTKHLGDVIGCMENGDELIVVDDASTDETVINLISSFNLHGGETTPEIPDLPKEYFPQLSKLKFQVYFGKFEKPHKKIRVVVVTNPVNFRFAGAVNVGVALSTHNNIFLINNDVSPAPDVIKVLSAHFEDDRVFSVGCLELQPLDNDLKAGKNRLWFEKGVFQHAKANDFDFGHTAWVSGGSGMFDRNKWLELGGLDQLFYPAYWEDIDLSVRAKKRGWQVLFDPSAIVYHMHETTNNEVFGQKQIMKMSWQNGDRFAWRHANPIQKIQFLILKPYWWWQRRKALKLNVAI